MNALGNKEIMAQNIQYYMNVNNFKRQDLCKIIDVPYTTLTDWINANTYPRIDKIELMAKCFNVSKSALVENHRNNTFNNLNRTDNFKPPTITDDVVVFPVIGDIAAGYDTIAVESWSGDTVTIPVEYLRGRKREEFFVLSVVGDSMYPLYMEGDKVLVLRQSTLNRSGEIGAVLYDDDCATLKRVDYVQGEDWLELIPINPIYPPKRIENAELERCRVMGIPWLLVRELDK